jgi:membrane protein
VGAPSSRTDRLDAFQRRHSLLGFPLGVIYKMADDRAIFLAALVTYYTFVSLFPLLLLFISIMGFVLQSHPGIRSDIVNSAIADVPGIGPVLKDNIQGFKGSGIGVAVGVVGVLYGGLGAAQSAQAAFNQMYAVPRNEQPNPITSRLRSLGWLAFLGIALVLSSGINFLVSNRNGISAEIGIGLKVLTYGVDFLINAGLFMVAFRVLTAAELGWRDVMTGGIVAGAGWELLQAFGSRFVVQQVNHGSSLYGVFGVVLAVLAVVYLVALLVMTSVEINVVRTRRLWPRSLLAPFTDDIDPTPADLVAYRSYAAAQTFKGWQHVAVRFEPGATEPEAD